MREHVHKPPSPGLRDVGCETLAFPVAFPGSMGQPPRLCNCGEASSAIQRRRVPHGAATAAVAYATLAMR